MPAGVLYLSADPPPPLLDRQEAASYEPLYRVDGLVLDDDMVLRAMDHEGSGAFIPVGLYGKPVPLDMDMVVRKELKVTAGFAQARSSWEILLKLLEGNSLMLEPLVSTRLPLADWKEGFAQFRDKKGIKIFLIP